VADNDATERKDGTERRVYMLPAGLLERLRAYQVSQGITSEAEAARRLLDTALQMRDTVADILNTLETRFVEEKDLRVLASEVLAKHFLVSEVSFKESDVSFKLRNGERGQITASGSLYSSPADAMDDDWSSYRRKPGYLLATQKPPAGPSWEPSKGGDLDDEIPF